MTQQETVSQTTDSGTPRIGDILGYARVSKFEQNPEAQHD